MPLAAEGAEGETRRWCGGRGIAEKRRFTRKYSKKDKKGEQMNQSEDCVFFLLLEQNLTKPALSSWITLRVSGSSSTPSSDRDWALQAGNYLLPLSLLPHFLYLFSTTIFWYQFSYSSLRTPFPPSHFGSFPPLFWNNPLSFSSPTWQNPFGSWSGDSDFFAQFSLSFLSSTPLSVHSYRPLSKGEKHGAFFKKHCTDFIETFRQFLTIFVLNPGCFLAHISFCRFSAVSTILESNRSAPSRHAGDDVSAVYSF